MSLTHLLGNQSVDFNSMILVVGEAFVNLRPSDAWEAATNFIHARTIDEEAHHIMHANTSSFNNRSARTNAGDPCQMAVSG